jgi:hypothetical protein
VTTRGKGAFVYGLPVTVITNSSAGCFVALDWPESLYIVRYLLIHADQTKENMMIVLDEKKAADIRDQSGLSIADLHRATRLLRTIPFCFFVLMISLSPFCRGL